MIFLILVMQISFAAASWDQVEGEIARVAVAGQIHDFNFEVYNSNHEKVYSFSSGTIPRERAVPVLSSSKWISAAVIMSLVDRGLIDLDAPLAAYVRRPNGGALSGPAADVTMRQLLSFTSGVEGRADDGTHVGSECYQESGISFVDCVQRVFDEMQPSFVPGAKFTYGNNHLVIAAWVATQVTGLSWNEIFAKTLAVPMKMTSDPKYYAKPRKSLSTDNLGLGHGLRISLIDYLQFLKMIFDYGEFDCERILTKASVVAMETNHWREGIEIGFSPARSVGVEAIYGLGVWIEKNSVSSVGLAGFYPWIDRESGYYAVLGAYEADSKIPAYRTSWQLAEKLKPLISRALRSE